MQNARAYSQYPLIEDFEFDVAGKDIDIFELKFKGFSKALVKLDLNMQVNDNIYTAKDVIVTHDGI